MVGNLTRTPGRKVTLAWGLIDGVLAQRVLDGDGWDEVA